MTMPLPDPALLPVADHAPQSSAPSDAELAVGARRGDDLSYTAPKCSSQGTIHSIPESANVDPRAQENLHQRRGTALATAYVRHSMRMCRVIWPLLSQ
jgi:hypothetical protein